MVKNFLIEKKILKVFIFLTIWNLSLGQPSHYSKTFYWLFGGSVPVWYKAEQPLMQNFSPPFHVFTEFGLRDKGLGIKLDYTPKITFKQDFVILNSQFISTQLVINTKLLFKSNFGLEVAGGPSYWFSTLSFENTGYLEKDQGLGIDYYGGIFANLWYFKLNIGFLYASSLNGAWFYAGRVYQQNIGTGSLQIILSISYDIL